MESVDKPTSPLANSKHMSKLLLIQQERPLGTDVWKSLPICLPERQPPDNTMVQLSATYASPGEEAWAVDVNRLLVIISTPVERRTTP